MDLAFIYIGISQSLFGALLVLLKKSLSIADKILVTWLLIICAAFLVNLLAIELEIEVDTLWPASVCLYLLFSQCVFLYSKYIIYEYKKFKTIDYLHIIPFIIAVSIILLSPAPSSYDLKSLINHYSQNMMLRILLGNMYVVSLWIYGVMSLKNIIRYRKQINDFYSFESEKNSLNWLLLLIIAYLLIHNFIIVISIIHLGQEYIPHVEKFRSGALLLFLYALSIWGYRQTQLSSIINIPKLDIPLSDKHEPESEKYKKSGLKKDQMNKYTEDLVHFMNTSEVWKDPELSIKKLSELTNIQSHYITQILSENLNKNFNTFVNEYRIEYAKELMMSKKYDSWSFLSISFESGFNSKATFNSFLKKQTGMTPSEFKKSNPSS